MLGINEPETITNWKKSPNLSRNRSINNSMLSRQNINNSTNNNYSNANQYISKRTNNDTTQPSSPTSSKAIPTITKNGALFNMNGDIIDRPLRRSSSTTSATKLTRSSSIKKEQPYFNGILHKSNTINSNTAVVNNMTSSNKPMKPVYINPKSDAIILSSNTKENEPNRNTNPLFNVNLSPIQKERSPNLLSPSLVYTGPPSSTTTTTNNEKKNKRRSRSFSGYTSVPPPSQYTNNPNRMMMNDSINYPGNPPPSRYQQPLPSQPQAQLPPPQQKQQSSSTNSHAPQRKNSLKNMARIVTRPLFDPPIIDPSLVANQPQPSGPSRPTPQRKNSLSAKSIKAIQHNNSLSANSMNQAKPPLPQNQNDSGHTLVAVNTSLGLQRSQSISAVKSAPPRRQAPPLPLSSTDNSITIDPMPQQPLNNGKTTLKRTQSLKASLQRWGVASKMNPPPPVPQGLTPMDPFVPSPNMPNGESEYHSLPRKLDFAKPNWHENPNLGKTSGLNENNFSSGLSRQSSLHKTKRMVQKRRAENISDEKSISANLSDRIVDNSKSVTSLNSPTTLGKSLTMKNSFTENSTLLRKHSYRFSIYSDLSDNSSVTSFSSNSAISEEDEDDLEPSVTETPSQAITEAPKEESAKVDNSEARFNRPRAVFYDEAKVAPNNNVNGYEPRVKEDFSELKLNETKENGQRSRANSNSLLGDNELFGKPMEIPKFDFDNEKEKEVKLRKSDENMINSKYSDRSFGIVVNSENNKNEDRPEDNYGDSLRNEKSGFEGISRIERVEKNSISEEEEEEEEEEEDEEKLIKEREEEERLRIIRNVNHFEEISAESRYIDDYNRGALKSSKELYNSDDDSDYPEDDGVEEVLYPTIKTRRSVESDINEEFPDLDVKSNTEVGYDDISTVVTPTITTTNYPLSSTDNEHDDISYTNSSKILPPTTTTKRYSHNSIYSDGNDTNISSPICNPNSILMNEDFNDNYFTSNIPINDEGSVKRSNSVSKTRKNILMRPRELFPRTASLKHLDNNKKEEEIKKEEEKEVEVEEVKEEIINVEKNMVKQENNLAKQEKSKVTESLDQLLIQLKKMKDEDELTEKSSKTTATSKSNGMNNNDHDITEGNTSKSYDDYSLSEKSEITEQSNTIKSQYSANETFKNQMHVPNINDSRVIISNLARKTPEPVWYEDTESISGKIHVIENKEVPRMKSIKSESQTTNTKSETSSVRQLKPDTSNLARSDSLKYSQSLKQDSAKSINSKENVSMFDKDANNKRIKRQLSPSLLSSQAWKYFSKENHHVIQPSQTPTTLGVVKSNYASPKLMHITRSRTMPVNRVKTPPMCTIPISEAITKSPVISAVPISEAISSNTNELNSIYQKTDNTNISIVIPPQQTKKSISQKIKLGKSPKQARPIYVISPALTSASHSLFDNKNPSGLSTVITEGKENSQRGVEAEEKEEEINSGEISPSGNNAKLRRRVPPPKNSEKKNEDTKTKKEEEEDKQAIRATITTTDELSEREALANDDQQAKESEKSYLPNISFDDTPLSAEICRALETELSSDLLLNSNISNSGKSDTTKRYSGRRRRSMPRPRSIVNTHRISYIQKQENKEDTIKEEPEKEEQSNDTKPIVFVLQDGLHHYNLVKKPLKNHERINLSSDTKEINEMNSIGMENNLNKKYMETTPMKFIVHSASMKEKSSPKDRSIQVDAKNTTNTIDRFGTKKSNYMDNYYNKNIDSHDNTISSPNGFNDVSYVLTPVKKKKNSFLKKSLQFSKIFKHKRNSSSSSSSKTPKISSPELISFSNNNGSLEKYSMNKSAMSGQPTTPIFRNNTLTTPASLNISPQISSPLVNTSESVTFSPYSERSQTPSSTNYSDFGNSEDYYNSSKPGKRNKIGRIFGSIKHKIK